MFTTWKQICRKNILPTFDLLVADKIIFQLKNCQNFRTHSSVWESWKFSDWMIISWRWRHFTKSFNISIFLSRQLLISGLKDGKNILLVKISSPRTLMDSSQRKMNSKNSMCHQTDSSGLIMLSFPRQVWKIFSKRC